MKKKLFAKALPLLLALIALVSIPCTTALADSAFTDSKDIGAAYASAVEYMSENGIIKGLDDGAFHPGDALTREQAAKIVAYLMLGSDDASKLKADVAPFADVAADRWSAGSVGYCVDNGVISGYGDGSFGPEDYVTGYQFAKMLLCAFGYGKADDYVGSAWASAVAADGSAIGLFIGDESIASNNALTRQQAALCAYNAVKAGRREGGIDSQLKVYNVEMNMLRAGGTIAGASRFYRNLDEDITFKLKLDYDSVKESGFITLKLRISEYNSNRVICSYIFGADIAAALSSDSTATVSYTGSLAAFMDYDESICADYFNDVNKYKVEVILDSHVLAAFTFSTSFNTQSADTFARQLKGETKFWSSTKVNEFVEQVNRVYSTKIIGMTRTLGAQFNISNAGSYIGQLPVTFKWSKNDDPLWHETQNIVVDFDGSDDITLDSYIYNSNNHTLENGVYTCSMYIFNTQVSSASCRISGDGK